MSNFSRRWAVQLLLGLTATTLAMMQAVRFASLPCLPEVANLEVPKLEVHKNFTHDWVVLLTTCRHRADANATREHELLYTSQILQWLTGTSMPVFVIESSGVGFPELGHHDNLHVITTKVEEKGSSSASEALSLLAALEGMKYSAKYKSATYILKVTGRYYLDKVEDVINRDLEPGYDFYLQKHRNPETSWQHSEYFGARKEHVPKLALSVLNGNKLMEHALWDVTTGNNTFTGFFEHGFPNSQARGGDGLTINPL